MNQEEYDARVEQIRAKIQTLIYTETSDLEGRDRFIIPLVALSAALADAAVRLVGRRPVIKPTPEMIAGLLNSSPWLNCAKQAVARWNAHKVTPS